MAVHARFEFEPRDCWLGLYYDYMPDPYGVKRLELWFCFIPMLVLHIWQRGRVMRHAG